MPHNFRNSWIYFNSLSFSIKPLIEIEVPCCSNLSFSDKFKDLGVGVSQLAALLLLLLWLLIDRLCANKFIELPDLLDFLEGLRASIASTSYTLRKSNGIGFAWSRTSLGSFNAF